MRSLLCWPSIVIGGGLLWALAGGHAAPGQAAEVTGQPAAQAVSDKNWRIALVAGNGQTGDLPADADSPATDLPVALPFGVEIGPDGHLYIASVSTRDLADDVEAEPDAAVGRTDFGAAHHGLEQRRKDSGQDGGPLVVHCD